MKYCPHCQTYYDEQTLKFCLKEGQPLMFVTQNDKLWSEGINQLRVAKNIAKREIRKKQIKKYISIIITMILIILVISVIFLNAWIYLNTTKDEVKNQVPQISTSPVSDPTVKPSPTELVLLPENSPTPNKTFSPTPTKTPTPTPTPTPITITKKSGCSNREITKSKASILESNHSYFIQSVNNLETELAIKYFKNNYEIYKFHPFSVSNNAPKQEIKMKDCSTFIVSLTSNWEPTTESRPSGFKPFSATKNFICSKNEANWNCEYLK